MAGSVSPARNKQMKVGTKGIRDSQIIEEIVLIGRNSYMEKPSAFLAIVALKYPLTK